MKAAALLVLVAGASLRSTPAQEEKLPPRVDETVLSTRVREVKRCESQAPEEEKTSSVRPVPSKQRMAMLPLGMNDGRREITPKTEEERRESGHDGRGKLFEASPRLRVAVGDERIRDKSGSHGLRQARLYLQEEGNGPRRPRVHWRCVRRSGPVRGPREKEKDGRRLAPMAPVLRVASRINYTPPPGSCQWLPKTSRLGPFP